MVSSSRIVCPGCRSVSPSGSNFCAHCGAPLGNAWRQAPRAPVGERRLLTVMFCDMVGSTRLASRIDPEDLHLVLLTFREACGSVIQRAGGTVGQYLGDGILAYFGYPRAREDDAPRALRAALRIQDAIPEVNATLARAGLSLPFPVSARIGVHSGLIVVADLGRGRNAEAAAVVGETTNMAARLQAAAATGTVLISDATAQLVGQRFEMADAGERSLAGIDDPVRVHELRAERPKTTLPAARTRHGGTPFFDRTVERARMRQAWAAARRGRGAFIVLEAEPGMGKSRLVDEFRSKIGSAGRVASVLTCSPEDRSSSFRPLLTWVRRELSVPEGAAPERLRGALQAALAGSVPNDHEIQLAVLLDCATESERRAFDHSPRRRRRSLVDAFMHFLSTRIGASERHLIVVEDLHWADDGTNAFIRALAEQCGAGSRLMTLVTTRQAPSEAGFTPETFKLERLPEEDAIGLVRSVVPDGSSDDLIRSIVQRTDGIPLFAEELARLTTAQERPETIPMTLRSTLSAQLDALGSAKGVAQVASALGRSFDQGVLEALVTERDRGRVGSALDRLVQARLVEVHPQPLPGASHAFRHALIRDAAYDSILRSRRRTLHGRIGRLLRDSAHDAALGRPEILAQHFAAADMEFDAAEQFEAAASRAAARSTHAEAVDHCRSGLEQLGKGVGELQTGDLEIRLQILLASQITAIRGNADPAVEAAFERARQVAERIGDERWLRRALRGLHTFHLVRGDIERGLEISQRVIELARGESDPGQRIQVHRPHGLTLLYLGRFEEARQELLAAIALYDADAHSDHRFTYGSDPLVLARSHLGWVEWFLGDPDRALAECAAAVRSARALDHPHSLAFALAFQCCLAEFVDDAAAAKNHAAELVHIAERHEYAYWLAWGRILGGWASAVLGERDSGDAAMQRGLADYQGTGAGLLVPYTHMLRAALLGQTDAAASRALLDLAHETAGRSQMGIWLHWANRRGRGR